MSQPRTPPVARRPVTLKRIADMLGLSVTTVARSLKDGHKISPETVQRVRDAADALGYVRNLDGLRLRTGRSYTITASITGDEDGDSYRPGLLAGIHQRLASTDYALRSLPRAVKADRPSKALASAIRSNPADGFILDRLMRTDERVALLEDNHLPFVCLGVVTSGPGMPGLAIDEASGARALTQALIAAGCRKILLLDDDDRYLDSATRRAAIGVALADAGLALAAGSDAGALPRAELLQTLVQRLRKGGIDGIICGSDWHFSVLHQAMRAAPVAPDAIRIALRSAQSRPPQFDGPLTIASFPAQRAGMILADLLLQRLEGRDPAELCQIELPEIVTIP